MPKRYYEKELPEAPIYVNGFPLRFDILETEDPILITELDKCARQGIGGIIVISEARYQEEHKKKAQESQSNGSSNKQPWRTELSASHNLGRLAAGGGSFAKPQEPRPPQIAMAQSPRQMPDPLVVPSPEDFKIPPPPVAKLNKPMP